MKKIWDKYFDLMMMIIMLVGIGIQFTSFGLTYAWFIILLYALKRFTR